jgi:ferric-dicitrate binding protein FerR (iron transport regulator)
MKGIIMENFMLDIIVRILKGEASQEDKQKLTNWLAQDQENMEIFKQSESVWNALEIVKMGKKYDSGKAFNTFKEQVNKRLKSSRRIGLYKKIDALIRIAAVFVILIGIGHLLIKPTDKSIKSDLSLFEIISPRGSKTQVLLPDGSKVWLNSESKIQYFNNFNQSGREVLLEGEGYFEVKKNPDKPFIVTTSDIRIKALGTTFNIKAYPGEKTIETTLVEGKLEVESDISGKVNKLATLVPNQKVTFLRENEAVPEQKNTEEKKKVEKAPPDKSALDKVISNVRVDPSLVTSWKNNILYFDNESFQDLAIKLERRFGVTIHFVDEDLKQMRFTGKFRDIIIEQVLEALQFASPFYYRLDDNNIYLSENPLKESPLKNIKNN